MTRNEAIKKVGLETVSLVEGENVEHTNRVTEGTIDAGYVEFSATVDFEVGCSVMIHPPVMSEPDELMLVMNVLVDEDEYKNADDLDLIDWDSAIKKATFEIC